MKLFAWMSLAALLAAGVGVGVSFAASDGATTGTTIHLIERDTSFTFLPLAGPRQGRIAKPGDESVFAGKLFTTDKKATGHTNVVCVATTGGTNPYLNCTGIFTLAGGTLVGSALVHGETGPNRVAILGGTGAYVGARGSVLSVPSKSNQNVSYDTIQLLQ